MSRAWKFLIWTKNKPHPSIYHAKDSKYVKFHKNLLQNQEDTGSQNWQFSQQNVHVCQGNACPLA